MAKSCKLDAGRTSTELMDGVRMLPYIGLHLGRGMIQYTDTGDTVHRYLTGELHMPDRSLITEMLVDASVVAANFFLLIH